MDLTKYNPQTAADTAAPFTLQDPFGDGPLVDDDGKELGGEVLGMQSEVSRNLDAKHRREMPKRDKPTDEMSEEEQAAYLEELQAYGKKAGAEKLAAMITTLHGNWQMGDKKVKASDKKALTDLLASQDWIADAVIGVAREVQNYRPKISRS